MNIAALHKVQGQILYDLRHQSALRYSAMQKKSGLESESFKFHLRTLLKHALVSKNEDGSYSLTPTGKEFANNLNEDIRTVQKQPKLSLVIVASRTTAEGTRQYLLQERLRNPYWGYWGLIGGPIRWGDAIEDAAAAELKKQTGLLADFRIKLFYRKRDYAKETENLLEDKLFAIVQADNVEGDMQNDWQHGRNAWMTLEELQQKSKYFGSTITMIDASSNGTSYLAEDARYAEDEY